MKPYTTIFSPSLLCFAALMCGTDSASALYLGPPAVYESPAAQAANLAKSRNKLKRLQNAARNCADMRLSIVHSSYAYLPLPVELPLSDYQIKQLRLLISRMQAVKDSNATLQQPEYIERLELLSSNGAVLATLDCHEVTTDTLVSAQGYASGARMSLNAADVSAWYSCTRPDEARAIARQPNPGRVPRGKGVPKRFQPPPPPQEPQAPSFEFPKEEYHSNCKHKHGKNHKHKSKNHRCSGH